MKKIISIISAMLIASVAFAITDAQKTAFFGISETIPADKAEREVFILEKDNSATIKPVAEWAMSDAVAFHEWNKENKNGILLVSTVNEYNAIKGVSYTMEQDLDLQDGKFTFEKAKTDSSVFAALKSSNFKSKNGRQMSAYRVLQLCTLYKDIAAADASLTKHQIASEFHNYMELVAECASVATTKRAAYELYAAVESRFESAMKYPNVSKNWSTFTAAVDAAGRRAKMAVELGTEQ